VARRRGASRVAGSLRVVPGPASRSGSRRDERRVRWGSVTDGLILLGFLAVIFAIFVAKGRRGLGMGVSARIFAVTVCGFAIAVLILWATQRR
jgi:hypothetical protein